MPPNCLLSHQFLGQGKKITYGLNVCRKGGILMLPLTIQQGTVKSIYKDLASVEKKRNELKKTSCISWIIFYNIFRLP